MLIFKNFLVISLRNLVISLRKNELIWILWVIVGVFLKSFSSHQLREKCLNSKFFWSVYYRIPTEYGDNLAIPPSLVRIREKNNWKKLEIQTHFMQRIRLQTKKVYIQNMFIFHLQFTFHNDIVLLDFTTCKLFCSDQAFLNSFMTEAVIIQKPVH